MSFFSDFTSDPKDPKDPVSYSTMMTTGGGGPTPTWPIALDLLQMLQRQRLPGCNSRFPASDVAVAPGFSFGGVKSWESKGIINHLLVP